MKNTVLVFRHVPHEGPGTLGTFLQEQGCTLEFCDLFGRRKFPKNPSAYALIVSMGGPVNVDEVVRYPFLLSERAFLLDAIQSGVPVVGICLGSQLIARALGARVYAGGQKEIGWYPIWLTNEATPDPVFGGIGARELLVFHWHGDTFDLPKDAVLLASSSLYRHQAFRFGTSVYAFQFHIEVTQEMIRNWIELNEDELKDAGILAKAPEIIKESTRYEPALQKLARPMYGRLFRETLNFSALKQS